MDRQLPDPSRSLIPHDRSNASSSFAVYTANSGVQTELTIPPTANQHRWLRIAPINGENLLVEVACKDNDGAPTAANCAIGSTFLDGSVKEYMIPLPKNPSVKLAGASTTATAQLTWVP